MSALVTKADLGVMRLAGIPEHSIEGLQTEGVCKLTFLQMNSLLQQARQDGAAKSLPEKVQAEIGKLDRYYDVRLEKAYQRLDRLLKVEKGVRSFQAIVADAVLWFDGFAAAHAHKDGWDAPRLPDRGQLRDLNGALLAALPEVEDAFAEVPF